jgi:hypothetical protein
MRVLIVAPEVPNTPALDAATEASRIGDIPGIDATILSGKEVTRERLLNRFQRGPYTLALWIGHGEPSRLLLSDGSTVDPRWLADQFAFAGVKIAVLSVCWSATRPSTSAPVLGFTDTIPALGITLIAMNTDVGDKAAAEYDIAFVQSFATGATVRRSHETGLEAIAKYGEAQNPQLFSADPAGTATSMKKLTEEIASLQSSITDGHPDAAHKSLVQISEIVGEIDKRLSEAYHVTFRNSEAISHLTERVDRIDATIHPPAEVIFYKTGVGFGVMAVLVALLVPPVSDIVFAVPAFGVFAIANVIALTALSARGIVLAQRKRNGTSKK